MVSIYCLKLKDNKYYVGKSANVISRINNHYNNNGCYWTQKYKPIETLFIYNDCDNYDEDKYTKMMMGKYGIENVRGGSYSQIILTPDIKNIIQREIYNAENCCLNCGIKGHFIKKCKNKIKSDNENIKSNNQKIIIFTFIISAIITSIIMRLFIMK